MSVRATLLSSLLLSLLVLAPAAEAAPVACVQPAPGIGGSPVPGPYWQVNFLTAATPNGICPTGIEAVGAAAACPPAPFVGVVPGAYCGAAVPWGGQLSCTWFRGFSLLGMAITMTIGYDLDGDGMLGPFDLAYDGWAAETMYGMGVDTFVNNNGAFTGGRLIAYPTAWTAPLNQPQPAWINCA